MTVLWTNDDVIFTDGDVIWTPHESGLTGSVAGVSNVSGVLSVTTQLAGSITGASGAVGHLNVATELIGSSVGASGASGNLSFFEIGLVGSTVGASGANASLSVVTELIGSTVGISGGSGSLNFLGIELAGSLVGASGVDANLTGIWTNRGSLTGISGASGNLNVTTELGSSIVEISGISASLGGIDVLTLLAAAAAAAAAVSGSLNMLIGLTALQGNLIAASSISGYLTIIPDFEATTLFWRPENNILETLEWKTSILKAHDGTEQRIKIRQSPRQLYKLQLVLMSDEANMWFDSVIHTWQKSAWLIPVWTDYVEHSASIAAKDDIITVDTTNADFRDNSKAIIWKSETEYEIVVISTKTDSQLNLDYSVLSAFTGDKYIIPVRTAYLVSSTRKEKSNSGVAIVDLIFAVYDNIDISGYLPDEVYDGFEILNTPAYIRGAHLEDTDGDVYIIDFETGIFRVGSSSNFNLLSQSHNFFNDSKSACWDFRKFLYALNGRQKPILIPTFRDDLIQIDNIGTTDTTVIVENIKLTDNMGFNSLRTYIGFYFPSTGSLIVRKITAIEELDSDEEQITIDANLGLDSPVVLGDCKICFVDKCRLSSDRVQIQWPYAHRNECQTNFTRVS